jgi:ParB family transcriptional regulator, chromosome partitioning protein
MSDPMSKMKRKGLGRGLDALLGANRGPATSADTPVNSATMPVANAGPQDGQMLEIPVEYLQRGKYQPRRDMQDEALQELAESIKAQGVMQPIVIRPLGPNRYEIIAGERRWRACQLAGLEKIPAIVRDVPDEAAVAMALIENIQREDLNAVEEAVALKRLQDEFSLTHQEVADAVGKSRTAVSNILRLLNLCPDVRTMLERGDLEMGHARCLLSLGEDQQRLLARQIVAKGLSVRQAEALVRQTSEDKPKTEFKPSADITRLQDRLSEQIGVPVTVQHSAKGAGKLVLKYSSLDELDGILSHLKYQP